MKKCGDIGLRGWLFPWLLQSHGMEPNFVPSSPILNLVSNPVNECDMRFASHRQVPNN